MGGGVSAERGPTPSDRRPPLPPPPSSSRQLKLAALSKDIGKVGLAVAVLVFVANVAAWLYRLGLPVRRI